ncbi:MAG: hypothetical protein IPM39_18250 [Chloroflexi bacterium]|nr:hypothetical protein [Chloroflexota bacterium]
MKSRSFDTIWWVVLVLVLAACGPGAADLALTVESQVAAAVQSTQAALPTPTAQSTFTPYPTYTPQATFTPYPTLTPYPTQTPLPTYTAVPTETAVPTAEPTATAVSSATLPTNPAAPTAVNNTTSDRERLANSIAAVLRHIDSFTYELQPRCTSVSASGSCQADFKANCGSLVNAYDGVINGRPPGFAPTDPQLQGMYASFGAEIDKFAATNQGWADGCREALAAGQTQKEVPHPQFALLIPTITEIINALNQLASQLSQ